MAEATCGKCGQRKAGVKWYSLPMAGDVTHMIELCSSCAKITPKSLPPQKPVK